MWTLPHTDGWLIAEVDKANNNPDEEPCQNNPAKETI